MSGSSSPIAIILTGVDRASKTIDQVNARIAAMRAPADRAAKSIAKFGDVTGITALSKGMRSVAEHSLSAFNNVARLVGPLAAITGATSVAGMSALVAEWASFQSALGFAATRAGLTSTQLNALQGSARLAGSSAEALTSGMTTLNDNLFLATAGRAPQAVQAFNYLGVAFHDAAGHSRNAADVLPELADKIAAIRDPAMQAQLATTLFGGAADNLLPFLRRGSAGIAEYVAISQRLNPVTQANTEAANRLREAQAELALAATGVGNSIATALEPELTPLLHNLADWIGNNRELIGQDVKEVVNDIAEAIKTLAVGANNVAQAMGGWKPVIEGIIALKLAGWAFGVARAFTPLLSLVQGLTTAFPSMAAAASAANVAGMIALAVYQDQESKRILGQSDQQIRDKYANPEQLGLLGRILRPFGLKSPFHQNTGLAPADTSATGQATSLIAGAEGYRSSAYWDVNHFRAGYGSDTTTDPVTGVVSPVTEATTGVSRDAARADLQRRVAGEFMPAAARAIGIDAWNKLSTSAQAAITSIAYNYGHVPSGVVTAARTGDANQIGTAIEGLRGDNEGINAARRDREAQIAMTPALAGPRAGPEPGIGDGTGSGATPAETKLTGGANLNIKLSGFPQGTSTSADAFGNMWAAPPRIDQAMPLGAGG